MSEITTERLDRSTPPLIPMGRALSTAGLRPAGREFEAQGSRRPVPIRVPVAPALGPALAKSPRDVLRHDVSRGLRYTHLRANLNTAELIQIASLAQATREVLEERKLIVSQEIERRQAATAERLSKEYSSKGMGVSFNHSDADKYDHRSEVVIDCENRIHLCKAACCKLRFALSRQDVEEGVVRWDFGRPYLIAQGADDYCVHLDRGRKCCAIYDARPCTCRAYDCRKDDRIWVDFEQKIPNPHLNDPDWPHNPNDATVSEAPVDRAGLPWATRCEASHLSRLLQALADRPVFYRFRCWYISAYGAFLSLGFSLGILYWMASISLRFGQPPPPFYFVAAIVLAAFSGSRLLRQLENLAAVRFGQAAIATRGYTFYGGLLGGLLCSAALAWTQPREVFLYADCAPAALGLGYALAKIGCLASGCCIGCPTRARLAVRYTHEMSKAVAFYGLKDEPLAPLQLYEAVVGLGLFASFSLLPSSFYGQGRAIGLFLVFLALGRSLLLPFRFRFADERAAPLVSSVAHLGLVAAGVLLLAPRGPSTKVVRETTVPPSLLGIILITCAVSMAVLYLFGVHRAETRTATGVS